MMGAVVENRCALCGKPVYSEQGYHAITHNHFDCEKKCHQVSIQHDVMNGYCISPVNTDQKELL